MFLNRKKKGYGWISVVNTDKKGDKVPDTDVKFINFNFAKDCEPTQYDLNERGSYQGDLFFRDSTGAERKVFPYIDDYYKEIVFKVLGKTNEYRDPKPTWQPKTDPKWDLSKEYTPRLDGKPDEEYWKLTASNITQDDPPFDE